MNHALNKLGIYVTSKDHYSYVNHSFWFDCNQFSNNVSIDQLLNKFVFDYILPYNEKLKLIIFKIENEHKSILEISDIINVQTDSKFALEYNIRPSSVVYSINLQSCSLESESITQQFLLVVKTLLKRNNQIIDLINNSKPKNDIDIALSRFHLIVEKIQNKFGCNIFWINTDLVCVQNNKIILKLVAENNSNMNLLIKLIDFFVKKLDDEHKESIKFLAKIFEEANEQ